MSLVSKCKQKAHVIVVGAGTAGLAAANTLVENGFTNVTILEADNRIGGRIWTSKIGENQLIELGAHWIHGVLGNPVYEVASRNRLIDFNDFRRPNDTLVVTSHGGKVSIKKVQEIGATYSKYINECCQYFESRRKPERHIESVGNHLDKNIHINLHKFREDESELVERQMIYNHFLTREECISGCNSVYDLDAAEFGSYVELPGGNHQLPKGFQSFIDTISPNIPQSDIRLKHEVCHIRWGKDRATVNVECTNGEKFEADHVICTISTGCLKHLVRNDAFIPALPDDKLRAIEKSNLGIVNKIYLVFDTPLQPLHISANISVIILLWQPTAASVGKGLQNCRRNVEDVKENWYRKLFVFTFVNPNILVSWIVGNEAAHMETLTDTDIINTCWRILKDALNNQHLPKPSQIIRSAWGSNPYTRGSYSYIPVGGRQEDIATLAQPLLHGTTGLPVLLFAGEATHTTYYSTVHGAYDSGLAAAKALADIYSAA